MDSKTKAALASVSATSAKTTGTIEGQAIPLLKRAEKRIQVGYARTMEQVPRKLRDVFRDLVAGRAKWPLYLYGPTGTGKTCAALALCDRARWAAYRTTETLVDEMLRRNGSGTIWDWLANPDLVVLDEIGSRESVKDLHYAATKQFSDIREMKASRVAVYISNVEPHLIRKLYDDRVYSRLCCGTWFCLSGSDRRWE